MSDPAIDNLAIESLPLVQRLALSYAPKAARESVLTLMLLDNRLASILRNRSEVIIAQMKLAWWRDRLAQDPADWPSGEPLLERLRDWGASPKELSPLVNGWERLLVDDLTIMALEEFAEGRARAWQALSPDLKADDAAAHSAIGHAARQWALADLALHLDTDEEADAARKLALAGNAQTAPLPRAQRSLAVLRGLARRALENGSAEMLDGPRAALVALRIGMTGR